MDEETFLAAIRAMPDDHRTRLVYADWLDENGQPEKAEFLRLQCELAIGFARVHQLRPGLDTAWREGVSLRYDLVLHAFDPGNKIALIKYTRELTGMGLADAASHIELNRCPFRLATGLTFEKAVQYCARFHLWATVTLEPPLPG